MKRFLISTMIAVMALSPVTAFADTPTDNGYDNGYGYEENGYAEENGEAADVPHLATTIATAETAAAQFMEAMSVAGMTVAVVDINNNFTWQQGFGYANAVEGTPITPDTVFSIASVAKTFTAVSIMQLVEEGLLDLDEPIITYLPEFSMRTNPVYGGDYRNITARMLLTHTSGIHEYQGEGFVSVEGQDPLALDNLMPILANLHMQNAELNRITYNNTAYSMLGILVARLRGNQDNFFQGFVDATDERIFAPLGMDNSSFAIDENNRGNITAPHDDATTPSEAFVYVSATPGGGMVASTTDMIAFMEAMLTDGGGILQPATVDEMFALQNMGITKPSAMPTGLEMGLGVMHWTRPNGATTTGHGGNLQHHSDMIIDRENGIGVFVSVNTTVAAPVPTLLAPMVWEAAVLELTGQPVATDGSFGTPVVIEDLQDVVGFYPMFGELIINENGNLAFTNVPGAGELELETEDYTTFTTIAGDVWFDKIDGFTFLFLDTDLVGERLNMVPATPEIAAFMGTIYDETGEIAVGSLSLNDRGYVVYEAGGLTFMANPVGDNAIHFAGRTRMLGSVMEFEVVDGEIFAQFSNSRVMIRPVVADEAVVEDSASEGSLLDLIAPEAPEVADADTGAEADAGAEAAVQAIDLRFIIGQEEFIFNQETLTAEQAPYIDTRYNRTMVPASVLATVFDATIEILDDETATITIGDTVVTLSLAESLPEGMGAALYNDGILLVPLAYVLIDLGVTIRWDGSSQTVYVLR